MDKFYCEHPDHIGVNRHIGYASDQYVMTCDVMSMDGRDRIARVGPRLVGEHGHPPHKGGLRLCRVCAKNMKTGLQTGAVRVLIDPPNYDGQGELL